MQKYVLVLPSPAKLNLMLHVLGRRQDGYHELQTLFQFLDYGDEMMFSVRDDGIIYLHTDFLGVAHDENLIVKAARKIQEQSGSSLGIDIWIKKVLPIGGGVGGGSSNAATTVLALNQLWQLGWDEDQLATLGLSLGADVPIFVRGHAAFAEGIGEILTPVHPEEPWYLVLILKGPISTEKVFLDPLLTRDSLPIMVSDIKDVMMRNDCEAIVRKRHPEVSASLNLLGKYTKARLTGTGSCIFGSFPNEADADNILSLIKGTLVGFVAKGSNTSMLHRKLRDLVKVTGTRYS